MRGNGVEYLFPKLLGLVYSTLHVFAEEDELHFYPFLFELVQKGETVDVFLDGGEVVDNESNAEVLEDNAAHE